MTTSVEIAASSDAVWPRIARFEHWPAWGPSVKAVDVDVDVDVDEVATGVTGRVQTTPGPWLSFEITGVSPGRSWSWRVAGIPATNHRITGLGPERCLVAFSIPWPAAAYLPVLRLGLRRLRSSVEGPA